MRELLEKYLDENGLSVVDFAEKAGVSKTTIYDLLKGEKNAGKIYVDVAVKIAAAMQIEVEELYGRKIPEPTPQRMSLTKDERELLDAWRQASDAAKTSAIMVLKANPAPVAKREDAAG